MEAVLLVGFAAERSDFSVSLNRFCRDLSDITHRILNSLANFPEAATGHPCQKPYERCSDQK